MQILALRRNNNNLATNILFVFSTAIISLLLTSSAILKLKSPSVLASWIHATFLWDVPSYTAYIIGIAEFATVAAILFPRSRQWGFYACAILSSGFFGISLARLVFDLKGNCGCYGAFAFPPQGQMSIAALLYILSISNLIFSRKSL